MLRQKGGGQGGRGELGGSASDGGEEASRSKGLGSKAARRWESKGRSDGGREGEADMRMKAWREERGGSAAKEAAANHLRQLAANMTSVSMRQKL